MMKAALVGYGRMGHAVEQALIGRGHRIVVRCDGPDLPPASVLREADLAFEFTAPDVAPRLITALVAAGVPVVSGTTGWDDAFEAVAEAVRAANGALFHASNFSMGMQLLRRLSDRLARSMNAPDGFDVTVEETHHRHKADVPSGTALALARGIVANYAGKERCIAGPATDAPTLGIHSVRRGEAPGEHRIVWESAGERIELSHTLLDRSALAEGAVAAAAFLLAEVRKGHRGLFTMDDLWNENT